MHLGDHGLTKVTVISARDTKLSAIPDKQNRGVISFIKNRPALQIAFGG